MFGKKIKLIWNTIKLEAKLLTDYEPILKKSFFYRFLVHKVFNSSLLYILTKALKSKPIIKTINIRTINNMYAYNPKLTPNAIQDIFIFSLKDPIINKYIMPMLYLKGFHVLCIYRLYSCIWNQNSQFLSTYIQNKISVVLNIDIHPASYIGNEIIFDHATGIVIGETSILKKSITILQQVTLGGTGKLKGNRHPKINEEVTIGAGTSVLGNIKIDNKVKIGAGTVVLHSIPKSKTAVGIPAKLTPHEF
ncbi:serine O-acetyltransferase EpsC [Candidatus Tremblaya phenacola]|uniref:serine O-acetyltransferase EpsC n=1 Tax=Candidatus Tremblayella phenacoccinincola TaxID=1010676 RepID=UPI001330CE8D|nr:serine O-acetyltransferase EpsC [Candidatus Tremblaya phenacola]KAH0998164.1 Serine acetyltransferase [Candidatus Tremblaya phenacola]